MARILVVDDEPANRLLAVTLLRYAGHQVDQAETADLGLEAARSTKPDLVILDLFLPGKHGTQFLKALRTDDDLKETKIALYTATQVDAMLEDFMKIYGVSHVIPKPTEPEDFIRIVGDALET